MIHHMMTGFLIAVMSAVAVVADEPAAGQPVPGDPAEALAYQRDQLPDYETLVLPALDEAAELPRPEGAPIEQARRCIGWANRLIGGSIGRPATRWVLGAADAEDRELIHACAKAALHYIDEGFDHLNDVDDASAERKRELWLKAETLEAFATLFVTARPDQLEDDLQSAAREAAFALATAREDADPAVAACALLWQSFAWDLAGRRDRALATLPGGLKPPKELPYDYLSRLLRCRLVAEEGQYTAGVVLAARCRQQCEEWFRARRIARYAERLAVIVQCRLMDAWAGSLDDPRTIAELHAGEVKLRTEYLDDDEPRVYDLDRAVPLLLDVPAPQKPEEHQASSGPADTEPPAVVPTTVPSTAPAQPPAETVAEPETRPADTQPVSTRPNP